MQDSVFKSFIRSCFVTIGVFLGLILGMFLLFAFFSAISDETTGKLKIETSYKPLVMPNAKGVRKEMAKTDPVILRLDLSGVIGIDGLSADSFRQQLIESREGEFKNGRVKALYLYISSPGGSAADADAIYRDIMSYKTNFKVPVYAFIDGIGASGGYYIACAADKIYATNSSIVGSIGVLIPPFLNFSQLLEKIGVGSMTLYAGKGKDNLNPVRPWKEGEQDNLQMVVNDFYTRFVDIVALNRPALDRAKLIENYGANVYMALESQKIGLVDNPEANESLVISELAQAIGITNDAYQVVGFQKKSWLSELLSERHKGSAFSGKMIHSLDIGDGIPHELRGKPLYLYRSDM